MKIIFLSPLYHQWSDSMKISKSPSYRKFWQVHSSILKVSNSKRNGALSYHFILSQISLIRRKSHSPKSEDL
eukprot:UN25270